MMSKLSDTDDSASPDLAKLAIALNISVSYLRHIFSKEVGIPPGRYLKLTRLARLRALLKDSNLRVKEAIAASGLSDFSHAVRDYKTVYGQTPSQTNGHE